MFTRVEIKFYSVLQLFKYVNSFRYSLQSFSTYWLFSTIFIESCQLTWIQFILKVGDRQLTLENLARVYPAYKQKCARPLPLPYKHPSKNYCCNPHKSVEIDFVELLLFFLINACVAGYQYSVTKSAPPVLFAQEKSTPPVLISQDVSIPFRIKVLPSNVILKIERDYLYTTQNDSLLKGNYFKEIQLYFQTFERFRFIFTNELQDFLSSHDGAPRQF